MKLEKAGMARWGESSETNYSAYAAFMQKWGVTKEKVAATELITNDLIDEINRFNSADIVAMAKAWKPK